MATFSVRFARSFARLSDDIVAVRKRGEETPDIVAGDAGALVRVRAAVTEEGVRAA